MDVEALLANIRLLSWQRSAALPSWPCRLLDTEPQADRFLKGAAVAGPLLGICLALQGRQTSITTVIAAVDVPAQSKR